jgi:hypothetical protein
MPRQANFQRAAPALHPGLQAALHRKVALRAAPHAPLHLREAAAAEGLQQDVLRVELHAGRQHRPGQRGLGTAGTQASTGLKKKLGQSLQKFGQKLISGALSHGEAFGAQFDRPKDNTGDKTQSISFGVEENGPEAPRGGGPAEARTDCMKFHAAIVKSIKISRSPGKKLCPRGLEG